MSRLPAIQPVLAVRTAWTVVSSRAHDGAAARAARRRNQRRLETGLYLLRDIGIERALLDCGATREECPGLIHVFRAAGSQSRPLGLFGTGL